MDENRIRLNIKKTEYMECGPRTIDRENLKKLTDFKYLGSTISSDGSIMTDVRS